MKVKTLKRNANEAEDKIKKIILDFITDNDVSVSGVELEIETVQNEFGVKYLTNMNVCLIVNL